MIDSHAMLSGLVAQAQAPEAGCPYASLIPIALMLLVIYFLLIRPQVRQARQHEQLVAALKTGDEVVTQGGLIGKVTAVSDRVITLEVARDVKVRVLRNQISGHYGEGQGQEAGAGSAQQSTWDTRK